MNEFTFVAVSLTIRSSRKPSGKTDLCFSGCTGTGSGDIASKNRLENAVMVGVADAGTGEEGTPICCP